MQAPFRDKCCNSEYNDHRNIIPFQLEESMPYDVFISYSHKDRKLRDELAVHLGNLRNQHVNSDWFDGDLIPGTEWEPHRFLSFSPFIARVAAGILSASRKDCLACVAASVSAWGAWRCATGATTVRNGRSPAGWAITLATASATSWGSGGVADRFSA